MPAPPSGRSLKFPSDQTPSQRTAIPTYISQLRFTGKGASAIKKSGARAASFAKVVARSGVRVEAQFWTAGANDGVLILSADNETKVLHCLTELAATGNLRPETMQAFDARQFQAITRG